MATTVIRTVTDDAADALSKLGALEQEIVNLRAHLERLRDQPRAPQALCAKRIAGVVTSLASEIGGLTWTAVDRTLRPTAVQEQGHS